MAGLSGTTVYDIRDAPAIDLGMMNTAVGSPTIPDRFDIDDIEAMYKQLTEWRARHTWVRECPVSS